MKVSADRLVGLRYVGICRISPFGAVVSSAGAELAINTSVLSVTLSCRRMKLKIILWREEGKSNVTVDTF